MAARPRPALPPRVRGAALPGSPQRFKGAAAAAPRAVRGAQRPPHAHSEFPARNGAPGAGFRWRVVIGRGKMEEAAPANGEAAPHEAANEGTDTAEAPANQQRDGERGAANGNHPPQDSANQAQGSGTSANEETEQYELTNESKELPTNEDEEHKAPDNECEGHKAPTNEDAGHKPSTNEDTGHKAPSNEASAPQPLANQHAAPSPAQPTSANEASAAQAEPSNELAALPEVTNEARDPWDWSLEEAWLRAPEGAGLEGWWEEPEEWEEGLEEDEDEEEEEEEKEEEEEEAEAERWWQSPDGALSKLTLRPGRGLERPGPGSRCRVLLTPPSSSAPPSPASGAGRWVTVRLGTAEGRWACAVDAGLETMTRGERARLRPSGATEAGATAPATVTVRLGRFTPAPPFWAAPPGCRWRAVTWGHSRAAALLARGSFGAAGRAFSRALRQAVAAAGPGPFPPEVTRVKAELHAGLALCQLRLALPAAAAANAGKALALCPAHLEARFRRAVAAAAMRDLEAAMADLAAVLRAQPGHAGARRELRRVRGAARERDARLARRLGRLFA